MTDADFQIAVITRDNRCVLCERYHGQHEYLTAHHVIPRRYQSVRHDPRNGVALCASCHTSGPRAVHRKPETAELRLVPIMVSAGLHAGWDEWEEYKRGARQ